MTDDAFLHALGLRYIPSLSLSRNVGFWVFRGRAFGGGADSGAAGRFWGEGFMRAAPGGRGGAAKRTFCSPGAMFW